MMSRMMRSCLRVGISNSFTVSFTPCECCAFVWSEMQKNRNHNNNNNRKYYFLKSDYVRYCLCYVALCHSHIHIYNLHSTSISYNVCILRNHIRMEEKEKVHILLFFCKSLKNHKLLCLMVMLCSIPLFTSSHRPVYRYYSCI